MDKKQFFRFVSIISIIAFVYFVLYVFASYIPNTTYDECYEFNTNEIGLINAIEKFKLGNPQFVAPQEFLAQKGAIRDSKYDSTKHLHEFIIYFKQENRIMGFKSEPQNNNSCEVALYALNQGPSFDNWKQLNRQLTRKETKVVKEEFEEQFLDKLGIQYKKEGNGTSIFYDWFH